MVLIAVFAIINVLVPLVLAPASGVLGSAVNIVVAIIRIVFWAVVAIVVIIFAFNIVECLLGGLPGLLPHR